MIAGTGRGVRVAVIDSGVHAAHPHVHGVAGGVGFDAEGRAHDDYVDRLGHGTAVVAAIQDLAPDVDVFAVKVFDRQLSTNITCLINAIEWAARGRMQVINLSLGTSRREHEATLREAVDVASAAGALVVAAREDAGVSYLPGSLPAALAVDVDWMCPRGEYRIVDIAGLTVIRTSGLPRQIPGVPPEQNLQGVSFAVANATAFVARAMEDPGVRTREQVLRRLAEKASRSGR